MTVVYILSSTRSGSTWLALMLGSNPDAAYLGELARMFRAELEGCSLCAERGVACPLFHDIAAYKPRDAHAMLSERTAKDVLVDNSKSLSWARKTLASSEARRYIHLLRDPRAVVNSWRRRGQNKGLEQWVDENKRIAKFLSDQQLDSRAVSYDELAQRTDETLAGLCEWLGLVYELAQKSYWRVEHHGAGRNGATAAFLTDFVASDEAFYAERRRTNFYDTRWREELDAATRRAIERDVRLKAFLQRAGFELTDDGLTPVRASARP